MGTGGGGGRERRGWAGGGGMIESREGREKEKKGWGGKNSERLGCRRSMRGYILT